MSRKNREGSVPRSDGGRRPTGDRGTGGRPERGRWSSKRKLEAVLRLFRGESLDAVSRELGVTAARLAEWRDVVLAAGQASLKSRPRDERDEEIARLRAKVGELTMDNELLLERCHRLEDGIRPRSRRSRR